MDEMRMRHRVFFYLFIIILVIVNIFLITSCGKPSEQKAYDEVIATMSTEKAKDFFKNYSQGKYRNKLVDEIMGWCKQDETAGCYKMILDAIPNEHPRHKEASAYYENHFGNSK